jgi:hypothetical protein
MRRHSLALTILVAIVIAAGLTWLAFSRASFGTSGAEDVVTDSHPVGPFKRVEVSGSAVVTLVQDTNGPLVVESDQRSRNRVDARVRGETLEITASNSRRWWNILAGHGTSSAPQITIHFQNLETIGVSGGVTVNAKELHVPALRIDGSGGTSVKIDDLRTSLLRVSGSGALKTVLAGQATDQNISISGAGEYLADQLVSDNAVVSVSGAGRVVLNVQKKLKATISGAGLIEYLGNPAVTEELSGVGRVKRRDSADLTLPRLASAL